MNAPKLTFVDVDNTYGVEGALLGISGFQGICERGPFASPEILITNWSDFRRIYGNFTVGTTFPEICKRALDRGAKLRISRVGHYTDISDPATIDYSVPDPVNFVDIAAVTPPQLFTITPKYAGAAYNELKVNVLNASNGSANYFDIEIYLANDKGVTYERYNNLFISGHPTIEQSKYLDQIVRDSFLVNVTYKDLSALTGQLRAKNVNAVFTGGTNSSTANAATDYVGSQGAKTGMYAFDSVDDIMQIATPEITDPVVINGGAAYADARGDLHYWAHLEPSSNVNTMLTARNAITTNSPYLAIFSGGINVPDVAYGGQFATLSEIGDIAGVAAYVDTKYGPWQSFSNIIKGAVPNALGVPYNYGSAGNYADLNQLAQRQIQMMVKDSNTIYTSGNYTAQLESSKRSFLNIMRGIVYIKKSLQPTLKKYLGEPTDFTTFKAIFNEVQPFFQSLVDKRFLYKDGWRWQGDQDASTLSELVVNTPADLDMGIYKVRLFLKPIAALQEIIVEITISPSSVNFESIDNEANS